MNTITAILAKKEKDIRHLAQFLYENPEIEMEEFAAKEKLLSLLEQEGFSICREIVGLPTAFAAQKTSGVGPNIAFTAEYDALPGLGHGCGHHLIGAMSYGAAVILAELLAEYPGTVTLLGTPAEETGRGKPGLLEAGFFAEVDAALMVHPHCFTVLKPTTTNLLGYDVTYHGKASHAAAAPEAGFNALDGAILALNGVSVLRQQTPDGARIHAIITDGGQAVNIIPETAKLRLELRHNDPTIFRQLDHRIKQVLQGAALASGCQVEIIQFEPQIDAMNNNPQLCQIFGESLQALGYPQEMIRQQFITGGCTDMGNVSWAVPSIQPMLEMVGGNTQPHTRQFLTESIQPFALEQTLLGAAALAATGLTLLQKPELLRLAQEQFRQSLPQ